MKYFQKNLKWKNVVESIVESIVKVFAKINLKKNFQFRQPNVQQPFRTIANFIQNSRSRFARNIILVENNRFRSSQLMRSAETLPAIIKPLKMRYLVLIIATLFMSCSQKNKNLQEKLEKEFEQTKLNIAGREGNIRTAPDWKAKVYYKNNKAILIFEETMPELGFTSKRIYCDESGVEIKKIVYRKCLPNWKGQNYKLQDSTFIIYPKQNLVESYYENKLVNSSNRVRFCERILKEAKYIKSQVE